MSARAKKPRVDAAEGTDSPASQQSGSSITNKSDSSWYLSDSSTGLGPPESSSEYIIFDIWSIYLLIIQTNSRITLLYIPSGLCVLVWPSKSEKLSAFLELAETSAFKPTMNTTVAVKVKNHPTEQFPLNQCVRCRQRFDESGLVSAVCGVQWGLLNTSTYNLELTVSYMGIYTCTTGLQVIECYILLKGSTAPPANNSCPKCH